jgi:hypothetical protein
MGRLSNKLQTFKIKPTINGFFNDTMEYGSVRNKEIPSFTT